MQVWTDFVDCFVDTVLAGGPVVASRNAEQVRTAGQYSAIMAPCLANESPDRRIMSAAVAAYV